VLPETDSAGATVIAERMRAAVESLNIPNTRGIDGRVTASIGHATLVPNDVAGTSTLMAAADVALYQTKRGGRNRVAAAAIVAAPPLAARG
jgi:diguanylate cyclase (GGDEF)-like protein